jgi:hypothetical protein
VNGTFSFILGMRAEQPATARMMNKIANFRIGFLWIAPIIGRVI